MDERTLCTRLKSWIDAELSSGTYAELSHADTEVHAAGGQFRHDIAIYADSELAFTCEVRIPTHPHGSSPYDHEFLTNARFKADSEGLSYFGTFNCASFVLWKVHDPRVPIPRRYVRRWKVVPGHLLAHLDTPGGERAFKEFLPKLLGELASIRQGVAATPGSAPEDEIVDLVEDRLHTIVGLTFPGVRERFVQDRAFRAALKSWMIRDQQWTWDDARADDLLLRATQIACYLLMNQLLFYETMRRRFSQLPAIDLGSATSGRGVEERLKPRFEAAMRLSRDYETVFEVGWISNVVFVGDTAAKAWAALVAGIRDVDLSSVSLDLLGGIFERLLSPEERHQFGQHYTSPELADLLLAATVREPNCKVFDPASGGGTFLVRAYHRKRYLGQHDHIALLADIFGNDISPFAAHLSVLNLAVRSLAPEENYPRVGAKDFLALEPGAPLTTIPELGGGRRTVAAPERVGALVGNPPYVRRQNIPASQWRSVSRALNASPPPRPQIHELSDLHTYFWVHGTRFLRPGDWLAFLSSSSWLENTSGRSLKTFLLREYDIVLLAESDAEPWFTGARVKTVATILRRRLSGTPVSNTATFALIRKPLAQIMAPRTSPERWSSVERVLDEILNGVTENATVWRVPQAELTADDPWSFYLRVPDLLVRWRRLANVTALAETFEVSVGPKLGGADFFKVVDVTARVATDPEELRRYGVKQSDIRGARPRVRVVEGLDGWVGPIESRYLKRTIRSPKHERTRVLGSDIGDLCLFIPRRDNIRGKKVAIYVGHGMRKGVGRRVYAGARTPWYSIEEKPRGPIVYPHAFQFGHKVWLNPGSRHYTCSPNAYLTPRECDPDTAAAILNSTWVYLDAVYAAGAVGVEGNTRFGGLRQWQRLHVPSLSHVNSQQQERLRELWSRMRDEEVADFPPAGEALLSGWRRELDELVVQLAGVSDPVEASDWVDDLYAWLRNHISRREHVESQAVAGRTGSAAGPSLRRVAEQTIAAISAQLRAPWMERIDMTWASVEIPTERVRAEAQRTLFGREGLAEDPRDVQFGERWLRFETAAQAEVVRCLAQAHLAPSACPVPPIGVAEDVAGAVTEFVRVLPEVVRKALAERLDVEDPSFDDTYAVAVNLATARVRGLIAEIVPGSERTPTSARPPSRRARTKRTGSGSIQ